MASVKEITQKCKAGQTAEAYQAALQDWDADPSNVWAQREVGWALYYLLMEDVQKQSPGSFREHLEMLGKLGLLASPQDDMLFDNITWKIVEYAKNMPDNAFGRLSELFGWIRDFMWFHPSRPYSTLLRRCLKFKGWPQMADFIDWWGLDNLLPGDYEDFTLENGKKTMSLAEQAYLEHSKSLLALGDKDRIAAFIPKLEALMDAHPGMLYPGYFCGKLLLRLGADRDEALAKVVPFVKKKAGEFWAWQLMAEIFRGDDQKETACLLRAAHCKAKEEYLGKVRVRLAELYIQAGDYPRARFQIDKVSKSYLEHGWRMPGQIQQWAHEPWLQTTRPDPSDPFGYQPVTDALLFPDMEEAIAVVTYVDQEHRRAAVVYGLRRKAMTKYGRWGMKPREGQLVKVKYTRRPDDGIDIVGAEAAPGPFGLPYLKEVSGVVDRREGNPFAFLKSGAERFFIPPALVGRHKLHGKEELSAVAVLDYNKKKDQWGWSCISVKPI